MLRKVPCRQYSKRHIFFELLRDLPRRERPARIRIEQYFQHHRWVKRLVPPRIGLLVMCVETGVVQLIHHFGDEVRQMPFRQPITQRGREQIALLGLVRSVVGWHASFYQPLPCFLPRRLLGSRWARPWPKCVLLPESCATDASQSPPSRKNTRPQ